METLQNKFFEIIPDLLEEGVLYISMERSIAIHLCICGCKNEVVTPFSPTDWELHFNGETISLSPSIGNWEFSCQSHYWIKNNQIKLANRWTEREIRSGRKNDAQRKLKYFEVKDTPKEEPDIQKKSKLTFWHKVIKCLGL